jgi:Cu2+-exporting ATPase
MTDIALPTASNLTPPRRTCAHCGEKVRGSADPAFCCQGCASAHAIIEAAGLGSFYGRLEETRAHRPVALETDFTSFARDDGKGECTLDLLIEGLDCAACVWLIESMLARNPAVTHARINFSTRRLALRWRGAVDQANGFAGLVAALGFRAAPYASLVAGMRDEAEMRDMLRNLAVAGFAAANVMLLSVAIWAGAAGTMGEATRTLFHWISAAIALPAVVYAGRPFYRSAFTALRAGRTNMDVPISIGVILACIVSLHQTWIGAEHAFFDSAITLLFFLLIGRYLERRARGRARQTVDALLALSNASASVVTPDGRIMARCVDQLRVGDTMLVAAGERLGADGIVREGTSSLDASLISGESLPLAVSPGARVVAGMINLGAPLRVRVTAAGEATVLGEIVRLVEASEHGRSKFIAIADRVARAYAPVVHLTAFLTFSGWMLSGAGWDQALLVAISVLIITCPCALALAVPVVQVVASSRLMRSGVLLLSPSALERLAQIDHVVLDKTGTLTLGRPKLVGDSDPESLRLAAGLAVNSRHPLGQALHRAAHDAEIVEGVIEVAGQGLQAGEMRLGSASFCGVPSLNDDQHSELWFMRPDHPPVRFAFANMLRPDAAASVAELQRQGLGVELLSGDRPAAVSTVAASVGLQHWRAGVSPTAKAERLGELARSGRRVLMVGDGLNDAPALAAAHASMSPTSAAEATQNAADAVFHGDRLSPVLETLGVARRAERLVSENLMLALLYNLGAVPLAITGYVTPLIAAIAMSSSSLLVIVNALRLGLGAPVRRKR